MNQTAGGHESSTIRPGGVNDHRSYTGASRALVFVGDESNLLAALRWVTGAFGRRFRVMLEGLPHPRTMTRTLARAARSPNFALGLPRVVWPGYPGAIGAGSTPLHAESTNGLCP